MRRLNGRGSKQRQKQRVHEFARWLGAVFSVHNTLRHTRAPRDRREILLMFSRTLAAQPVVVAKARARRRHVLERRLVRVPSTDASSAESSESESELSLSAIVGPSAILNDAEQGAEVDAEGGDVVMEG